MKPDLQKKLKFMKKGAGEAVVFVWLIPVIVGLLVTLSVFVNYADTKQKMMYTAYFSCRAAAVCDSLPEAKKKALEVAKNNLKAYSDVINPDSVSVNLTIMKDKNGYKSKKTRTRSFSGKKNRHGWDKGNYVALVLSADPSHSGLVAKKISVKIVMAIESDSASEAA